MTHRDVSLPKSLSRRRLLKDSAAVAAGMGALSLGQFIPWVGASAEDRPAIGTWPAGSQGDTVNVAAAVPRTGTYAVQGEDELKGWQLAVEHINNGDPLLQKIAPKVTKGLLGKKVNLVAAELSGEAQPGRSRDPDLHQPEQDRLDDGLHVKRGRRRAQQVRPA